MDIVGHAVLICGFSPDFFKRKTWTHHYLLCVVCLSDHCPSPRGVPLFANVEARLTGFGESGECSALVTLRLVPPGARAGPELAPVTADVLGGRTEAGSPPCSVGFRVFQFCFGFLFLLFFFFHFSFTPWHNEACLSQCYAMDFYENSVSATQFFLMQYIHL